MAKRGGEYFLVIMLGVGLAVALAEDKNMANWAAAEAHLSEAFVVAEDATTVSATVPLAFYHGKLMARSSLTDPLTKATLTGPVALSVKEERYERSGKKSSWHTKQTFSAYAQTSVGAFTLAREMLQDDAEELWRPLKVNNPAQIAWLQRYYPSTRLIGDTVEVETDHRYVYRAISGPQDVTAIASIEPDGRDGAVIKPSPLMPKDYPGLLQGPVTPTQFVARLHESMVWRLAIVSGLMLGFGASLLGVIDYKLFSQRRVGLVMVGLSAFASSIAGGLSWYLTADKLIGAGASLAVLLGLYALLQITLPRRAIEETPYVG